MTIKLYYTHGTRATRPRWMLEELGLDYTLVPIDLFSGEGQSPTYKKIHPLGYVPAIEIDGRVQIESGAICHWLADQYPEKGLAPGISSPDRMRYEQWMFFAPGTLEPPAWLVLLHGRVLPESKRIDAIVPWALQRYDGILAALNQEMTGRDYIATDQFTAADIMIGSILMWLPDSLKAYSSLSDYVACLKARQAWQRATVDPRDPA